MSERPHIRFSEAKVGKAGRNVVPGKSFRLHGEVHDFEELIEYYGSKFVTRLMDCVVLVYLNANPSSATKKIYNLKRFFKYLYRMSLDEFDGPHARAFQSLSEDEPSAVDKADLDAVALSYRDRLSDLSDFSVVGARRYASRQSYLDSTSMALRDIHAELGLPRPEPLRSMSERNADITSLTVSLGEVCRDGEVVDVSKVLELSRERLARLRSRCVDILLAEERTFDLGAELLSDETVSLDEIAKAIVVLPRTYSPDRGGEVPQIAVASFGGGRDRALSSFLRHIRHKYGGPRQYVWMTREERVISDAMGPFADLRGYFGGTLKALVAAYLIVLIDTGANSQPIDDLPANFSRGTVKSGGMTFALVPSRKRRAGDKRVDFLLEGGEASGESSTLTIPTHSPNSSLSALNALRIWSKLSAPFRGHASEQVAKFLWLQPRTDDPRHVGVYRLSGFSKGLAAIVEELDADPVLRGLRFNRKTIRKTVAQLSSLKTGLNIDTAALLVDHSSIGTTTKWYLNSASIHKILEQRIREFQNLLEAGLLGSRKDLARRLGISSELLTSRQVKAAETGLGLFCLDVHVSGETGDLAETSCFRLDRCASCAFMRFYPDAQSIEDIVFLHRSLADVADEFIGINPARWVEVWLPLFALSQAIIAKLTEGPKQALLVKAKSKLEARLAGGELKLFRPW